MNGLQPSEAEAGFLFGNSVSDGCKFFVMKAVPYLAHSPSARGQGIRSSGDTSSWVCYPGPPPPESTVEAWSQWVKVATCLNIHLMSCLPNTRKSQGQMPAPTTDTVVYWGGGVTNPRNCTHESDVRPSHWQPMIYFALRCQISMPQRDFEIEIDNPVFKF